MLKRFFALAALAAVFTVGYPVPEAAAGPSKAGAGSKFVGTWVANVTADGGVIPPFTNLTTNTADGAVINADPEMGTGLGTWQKTGARTAAVSFVTLVPLDHPNFPPGTQVSVNGKVEVAKDGKTATGQFESVFSHPQNGMLFSFTGTVVFERLPAAP